MGRSIGGTVLFAFVLAGAGQSQEDPREALRAALRERRNARPETGDLATAFLVLTSREEKAWALGPATAKAFRDYLDLAWRKGPAVLSDQDHLRAAVFLAERHATLPKQRGRDDEFLLRLFGAAHIAMAPAGPERDAAAARLGLLWVGTRLGTEEGFAVADMRAWLDLSDYVFADVAYRAEHARLETPALRYLWSWSLLRRAIEKRKPFDRALVEFERVKPEDPAAGEWLAPLVRTIRQVRPCATCLGEGRLRCTVCHGRGERRPGGEPCDECRSSGHRSCPSCKGPKSYPSVGDICSFTTCDLCEGRVSVLPRVILPCPSCLGLGTRPISAAPPPKGSAD